MVPKGWKKIKLGDLGKIITGQTPKFSNPHHFGSEYPFITPTDMDKRRYMTVTNRNLSSDGSKAFHRISLPKNTVSVSCIGWQMGKTVLTARKSFTNQQIHSIVVDQEKIDPLFLYYSLKIRREELFRLGSGGSRTPILNKTSFENLNGIFPTLSKQRIVGKILGSFDEKIELNDIMNQTLEQISSLIFKSWFIHFDFPNTDGNPYKTSGGTMENSDLGEIPKGWRSSEIGKELKIILGGTPDRNNDDFWRNGTVPWINSGKINEFRIIEPSEHITKVGLANSATKSLPPRTTVLAITGTTVGQVSLLEIESCANQSVIALLGSQKIPSEFIYFWVKHMIDDITSWQTGGAQQHINKENVTNTPLLVPNNQIIENYLKTVKPFFDKIAKNCFENKKLARLRDKLLPELVSGKITMEQNYKKEK